METKPGREIDRKTMPSKISVKVGDTVKLTGVVGSVAEDGFATVRFPAGDEGETYTLGIHPKVMLHAEIIPKTLSIPEDVVEAIKEAFPDEFCDGKYSILHDWLESHRTKE